MIRVLIVDDHTILRSGLKALLDREGDIEVVAEADTGREAVRMARELVPDVAVMDVLMPGMNGIEATRQIKSTVATVRILALSMSADRQSITEILKAGAFGYLLKDCALDELVRAIREVAAGRRYLGTGVSDVVVEDYLKNLSQGSPPVSSVLTAREREVLQLLAEGQSTRSIASLLGVSAKTVETHRRHIMRKLNLSGVAELTKFAIREGLISLDG